MNIVLVDDEQVILDGLGKMISQLDDGWQVCAAFTDAEEALNSCDWDQVQVLLVDITMPGMSGLALVEALRENAFDTLVIFVTAHADFSYAQRGAHLQMFDYLLKPISTDELQKVLRRAEKTSRKNLQARESQEYIRRNLHVLRKHFLGDYMFEERMISGEELTQRKKDYALENMSYAIALLQSVLPRNIVKEKLSTVLTAHQWMLYGQENSYELLLLCQQPLELSILPRCIPAPEGRWRIAPEWLRLEQLPDAFQKLLMSGIPANAPEAEMENISLPDEKLPSSVRMAIQYIREHYRQSLSLGQIAEAVYLHPTYLSNLFKKQTGYAVVDYINMFRIQRAKDLLKDPRNRIYWIVEQVGFSNQRYFSAVFKKNTGLTPMQYRQQLLMERPK